MKTVCTLTADGCDRATAYHMSNKIVRRSDGLYVTWLDAAYRCILARVEPDSGRVAAAFSLAQGFDNHCGAALAQAPDGRMHFMAGSHRRGAFIHRWSDTPSDPASWSLPEAVGAEPTYPSFVCTPGGLLCLAHRQGWDAHWGVNWLTRRPGDQWSWPYMLVQAPDLRYSFPTNSLAVGPDGSIHLLVEFYKTYPGDRVSPHSMAVTHLVSPDGLKWFHDDGREVKHAPVRIEDTPHVRFKAGGDLRPGNLTVLPDGQPAFAFCDSHAGRTELATRRADGSWRCTDVTAHALRQRPGWRTAPQAQIAVDRDGLLVLVMPIAPDGAWGHPETELSVLWAEPATGRVVHQAMPTRFAAGEPDWLSSLEKGNVGLPDHGLYLMHTSGRRGEGCVNAARCAVRLLQLGR